MLSLVRNILRSLPLRCRHRHPSWPFYKYQVCLDCGARRPYVIGLPPGRWHHTKSETPSTVKVFVLEKDRT
jgi:hypothetical protein